MQNKIRIGLLGAGHLGKFHLRNLLNIDKFHLIGIYDQNPETAKIVANEFGVTSFSSSTDLLNNVDAIDIVTPTQFHYDYALKAISLGKHIFIEKPITSTLSQAQDILVLSQDKGIVVQVGHIERFNPAFVAVKDKIDNPLFIEAHRLSEFKPRGTDVSVVLDLMIHDIDLVLYMLNGLLPDKISASGVSVISNNIDIANARLEFPNGCVANLTASRVSVKNERKIRIFKKNAYFSIDLQKMVSNVFELHELEENEIPTSDMVYQPINGDKRKEIFYSQPDIISSNAIEQELICFADSILNNKPSLVPALDGYNNLSIAIEIMNQCDKIRLKAL